MIYKSLRVFAYQYHLFLNLKIIIMKKFVLTSKEINSICLYIVLTAVILLHGACRKLNDCNLPEVKITKVTSGLAGPIGLETDKWGNVWISETGSGNNDGKISVVTHDGKKYDAITGLASFITKLGETEGPAHLLFANGYLYILGAGSKLLKADVSKFKPGDNAINGASLPAEDIGAYVLGYNFVNNTHETHLYGITQGPEGAFYMADAAANAIIRRSKTGELSVVAEVPGVANPLAFGPPQLQSVPTGIIFDGKDFLVTTLMGFPFPPGVSVIYKISQSGDVAVYQNGFTSLVDISQSSIGGNLVVEHGVFGEMGFAPGSGRILWANGKTTKVFAEGFNQPTAIKQAGFNTWYVTSLTDNSLFKITYR